MSAQFSYFRMMDPSDLDWVLSTERAAYAFPWSKQGFDKAMDDGLAYVLCSDEQTPLGYACFLSVLDEIHLLNFCIHPDFQGRGIGREALSKFKTHFAEASFVVMLLEVRESNPAKALYRKLGFQEDGVRKGYYARKDSNGREDAVLMSLPL